MIKKFFAVLLGIVVAVATIATIEYIGHFFYPPENIDLNDPEALKAMMGQAPVAALLFVLGAWFAGAFAGATTALIMTKNNRFAFAAIVSAFILIAAVVTTISIPHPFWFVAAAIIGIPVAGWLAWRIRQ